MAAGTAPIRPRRRVMQVHVARVSGTSVPFDADIRYSAVGAFAALLVEWKLAEREQADMPFRVKSA
jgi:hypothetical protein